MSSERRATKRRLVGKRAAMRGVLLCVEQAIHGRPRQPVTRAICANFLPAAFISVTAVA